MNFPKRDELSFLSLLAFPNASRIALDCSTRCSMDDVSRPATCPESTFAERAARYCMMNFVVTVFPAPLSPLTSTPRHVHVR